MTQNFCASYKLDAIRDALTIDDVLAAVRAALIDHSRGETISPPPGQLLFEKAQGDCHIKFSRSRNGPVFVVKVATGFYANPSDGLPVNNGIVLLFSSTTGAPLAIFNDEGWLTSWRTAAAGALAAKVGSPNRPSMLGIVGTGHQAELQAIWASHALGGLPIMLWGRSAQRADFLIDKLRASGLAAERADHLDGLMQACRLVICCTNASTPLIESSLVRAGTHIVSIGADGPGKSEIEPRLFGRASAILTDDHDHCLAHGDFGRAVANGHVRADADIHLGSVLENGSSIRHNDDDITIATLTGLGAEDLAIASLAWSKLTEK